MIKKLSGVSTLWLSTSGLTSITRGAQKAYGGLRLRLIPLPFHNPNLDPPKQFANHIRPTYAKLNELIHAKKSVTPDTALDLGDVFYMEPDFWMNLQRKCAIIDYRILIISKMIKSFASKLAEDIFDGVDSRYSRKFPNQLTAKARRKLDQLNAATKLDTLKIPPANKLTKLEGNLSNYWRIKIDKQWAVIFKWNDGFAIDVDIVDYH